MQDLICRIVESFLHRAAGPYIGSKPVRDLEPAEPECRYERQTPGEITSQKIDPGVGRRVRVNGRQTKYGGWHPHGQSA